VLRGGGEVQAGVVMTSERRVATLADRVAVG
jgi:hypothetical protein